MQQLCGNILSTAVVPLVLVFRQISDDRLTAAHWVRSQSYMCRVSRVRVFCVYRRGAIVRALIIELFSNAVFAHVLQINVALLGSSAAVFVVFKGRYMRHDMEEGRRLVKEQRDAAESAAVTPSTDMVNDGNDRGSATARSPSTRRNRSRAPSQTMRRRSETTRCCAPLCTDLAEQVGVDIIVVDDAENLAVHEIQHRLNLRPRDQPKSLAHPLLPVNN